MVCEQRGGPMVCEQRGGPRVHHLSRELASPPAVSVALRRHGEMVWNVRRLDDRSLYTPKESENTAHDASHSAPASPNGTGGR